MKVKIRNFEFEVVDEHVAWFWPLVNEGKWGRFEFDSIDKSIKRNIFWDIGAWNGVVSLYASKFFNKVIAFEPDWKAFNFLSENIKANNIQNITIIREGIYNIDGHIALGEGITGGGSSTSSIKSSKNSDLYSIRVSTLKTIINKYGTPDFIKMDIEGSEEDIIEELLLLNIPCIAIEIHLQLMSNPSLFLSKFTNAFNNYYIYNNQFNEIKVLKEEGNYLLLKNEYSCN